VFLVGSELDCYFPGDGIIHSHSRKNLKYYIILLWPGALTRDSDNLPPTFKSLP
jgi:hypothetical protein